MNERQEIRDVQQTKETKKSMQNYLLFFLLLMALWANVKSIFMECDIDSEYAVAMSYRMLIGDEMFLQMWEPHQTSAFLCTLLMKLFVTMTGGTTGVIVYLQFMGVLIHGAVTWIFYQFLKKRVDLQTARLMSILLLAVRPKDIVFPEFSNMQLWFSILLFISLLYYLEHQNQKRWLLLSSLFLCLEVISYPSCVLVWVAVAGLLWVYSAAKIKDILLFTISCAAQGILYTGYFVAKVGGIGTFLATLNHIVSSDASHQKEGRADVVLFWQEFLLSVLWLAGCLLVAFIICKLLKKRNYFVLLTAVLLLVVLAVRVEVRPNHGAHVIMYPLVILWAMKASSRCEKQEKRIVFTGISISVCSVVATGLLTNLDLTSTLMYLILGVAVSLIPLGKLQAQEVIFGKRVLKIEVIVLFCFIILFQRSVLVKTFGGFSNPLELGGIVRSGPAVGMLSDYMGALVRNTTMAEWSQFVQEGDSVLIAERGSMSALGYLYGDTSVSVPSTICTPTFDESLLEYWEKYPEKYPDVVVVQCWYGELKVEEDSWLMRWLHEECELETVSDGTFWRFYRLRK